MLMPRNGFVIARLVIFALLTNLNILILVLAVWDINIATSSNLPVQITVVLCAVESCMLFLGVFLGTAELMFPRFAISSVFECLWSAILVAFQTATAIGVTANNATICGFSHHKQSWNLCISSSLLIPTTWLSNIILLSHFLLLLFTAVAHRHLIPDVWFRSVYSVDWFNSNGEMNSSNKIKPKTDLWARNIRDIEARPRGEVKAPWARPIRRGIDSPFKLSNPSSVTSPASMSTLVPIAPPRVQSRSVAGCRFMEKFRDTSRTENGVHVHFTKDIRATKQERRVADHDLPIPLPRYSEWIRADAFPDLKPQTFPTSRPGYV